MAKIDGRFFPAGTNSSVRASVQRRGDLALITLEDAIEEGGRRSKVFSAEISQISDRLGSVARKITLNDGSVFEARDNDGIDEMFDLGGGFFGFLPKAESSLTIVAAVTVCTIVLLVGLYRYGLPAMASGAAKITPSAILTLMDRSTLATVDRVFFDKSSLNARRKDEVGAVFVALAEQSGHKEPELRLLFRDGGKLGANAIALPGGTIIITDQLIAKAKNDDEIAGVLGHEIGHVERRHSLRQIYRVLGVGFMIAVIGGDSGQLVEDVVAQAVALESLSYSRSFETESDFRSAELMVGLGRDPYAFVELLKRITNDKGEKSKTGWLSTHPGTFERMETVRKYVDSIRR